MRTEVKLPVTKEQLAVFVDQALEEVDAFITSEDSYNFKTEDKFVNLLAQKLGITE